MKQSKKASKKNVNKTVKKTVRSTSKKSVVNKNDDIQKLVHLLQVNQIELEHQNQELRLTEQELEASRSKYVNLFDFSPIPYYALDPEGIIKEVNLTAAKMFGVERSKLIGKNFMSYILPEDKNIFSTFINTVCNSSVKQTCKVTVVNKDKSTFYVLLEGVQLVDPLEPEQRCQIALTDLTEYKRLEESYKKLSEELALLKTSRS